MGAKTASEKSQAEIQAEMWGERARDWADVMEGWDGWGIPLYRHVLQRVPVAVDTDLLDVGCGAGRFSRMAADRGARCSGLDATPAFIEIASERVPDGDFRVGDMEQLPWADDSFDVVTGFNSFFIAGDMVVALREAQRVARPGGKVATSVFGRPERCDSGVLFATLAQFMPEKPGGQGKSDKPLHEESALGELATKAGLTPEESGYVEIVEDYRDLETLLRGFMASPPSVRATRAAGIEAVRKALSQALEPFRLESGRYRLMEEARFLIATA